MMGIIEGAEAERCFRPTFSYSPPLLSDLLQTHLLISILIPEEVMETFHGDWAQIFEP